MASRVKIRRLRKGEVFRADDWNKMCGVVEALARVQTGPGLSASFGVEGLLIAMIGGLKDRLVWCKITEAPPPSVAIMPSNCKYGYVGLDKKGVAESDVLPVYGRQVENEETAIYPAKVGHLCAIFRNPQPDGTKKAELIVFTESPVRGPC